MDWRNLLFLEHLGSTLPLHIKIRVFSGFGLCLIFSVLVVYLLVPSSFSTDTPGAKSLFSWVSSSFSNPGKQENHPTMIDENSNTTGGVLEKTHVRNLSGDGVVAGSVGKGVSRSASSSLSGNGGVEEEKSNETIVLVAGNQTVSDAGNETIVLVAGNHTVSDAGNETIVLVAGNHTVSDAGNETESMEHGNISSGLDFRKKLEGDVGVSKRCDIFDGRWVRDRRKPFYTAGSCPYIDRDFNCHKNGRPDFEFLNWRWQPNGCDIPRLNATDFLKRLRGKRLVFVGDSLNRNMWESLICILRQSIPNKKSVSEISGRSQFKTKGFYSFKFKDCNCTIEFVRSPFLVKESYGKGINGTQDEKLRLDLLDETARAYHEADIIVFNTGHWWTHEKTSRGVDYYQEGNYVHPVLKVMQAYDKALTTWAKWVDKNINANKTRVIYRGYSLTHFKGGQWNSGGHCHKETEPIFNDTFLAKYPSKMRLLEHVLKHMKTPVMYLNISHLTDYRKDGHPSIYRMKYKSVQEQIAAERSQDCSHWCLPGVPDTWNELLYASLLMDGKGSWRN